MNETCEILLIREILAGFGVPGAMDTNVWLPSDKRWPVTRRGCQIPAPHSNIADQIVKPPHRVVWRGEDGHITAIREEPADHPRTDESGGTRDKGFSHGQPFLPSQV